MAPVTLTKIFIVASLEIAFLVISFIFIGLGIKELKRKKKVFNNIFLIISGVIIGLGSLWCAKILLLY